MPLRLSCPERVHAGKKARLCGISWIPDSCLPPDVRSIPFSSSSLLLALGNPRSTRHSVNEARDSWTLLDTATMAGQMGTSGSRPQRLNNGRKANKDNPVSHCRPKLPGAQSWAGKIGFLFHGSRGKRGAGEPAVGLSFLFMPVMSVSVTTRDNL